MKKSKERMKVTSLDLQHDGQTATLLGACCLCEGTKGVRNLLSLRQKATMPGRGWGCLQCELPGDGAIAVVCDACLKRVQAGEPLKFACLDYVTTGKRIPIGDITGEHDHDYSRHPEIE